MTLQEKTKHIVLGANLRYRLSKVIASVSRLLSTIFHTLQRILTTEGARDMILVSNATTNTLLFSTTVTARNMLLCWKGKPSIEDKSLPIIDHMDLLSSFSTKHHLNY